MEAFKVFLDSIATGIMSNPTTKYTFLGLIAFIAFLKGYNWWTNFKRKL